MTARTAAILCGMFLVANAYSASNIMIWPVDPMIAPKDSATELWVQNQGTTPAVLQARIVRWEQWEGQDRYQQQQDVVASPPIIQVAPGGKQLFRLIKQSLVPANQEQAYRIVVDEIPQPVDNQSKQLGFRLMMRYSIPLFVYGEGINVKPDGENRTQVDVSRLRWHVEEQGGQQHLAIRNDGPVHLRISQVGLRQGGTSRSIAEGLMGYVLAGTEQRFPLPAGISHPDSMTATINATPAKWQSAPTR